MRLVSISIRTIRADYATFPGANSVEGWLASGTVEVYFDQNPPDCRVVEEGGESVGISVAKGGMIDLAMIDCDRRRQVFGRALLDHVETELFETHPVSRPESFADNRSANAFRAAQCWTPGELFQDPAAGVAKFPISKRRSAEAA